MKRALIGAVIGLTVSLFASPVLAQKVSFGLKGGVNFTNITGGDMEFDVATRLVGGGFMVAPILKSIGFMPEVLYSQKGAKATIDGVDVDMNLDYIEVPMLFRIAPRTQTEKVMPFAMVGPAIAFRTRCKATGEDAGVSVTMNCSDEAFDVKVNDIDYGAVVGAGTDVALGRAAITLDARYTYGLSELVDTEGEHNSVFTLMVGFRMLPRTGVLALK